MRTSTLILSLTTITFAATTCWLSWELHQRDAIDAVRPALAGSRDSLPAAAHTSTAAQADAPVAGRIDTVPASVSSATPDPLVPGVAPPGRRDLSQDPTVMFARQVLARYDESAQRQAQLEEARTGVRRQYASLKEQLGLGDAKFEQLVDLIAQQNLQAQEHWARCAIDAACDPNNPAPLDDRSQELLALLGPEHIDAFNRYRGSLGERDSVAAFRGRLSDAQFLPQAQAEQLITALTQERELYSREVEQSGSRLRGYGTNLGMIWYPDSAGTAEAQLLEAAQFSQRIRARAATVLTPAQMAAFVQMQEELLAQMAMFLRPPPPSRKADSLKLAQG